MPGKDRNHFQLTRQIKQQQQQHLTFKSAGLERENWQKQRTHRYAIVCPPHRDESSNSTKLIVVTYRDVLIILQGHGKKNNNTFEKRNGRTRTARRKSRSGNFRRAVPRQAEKSVTSSKKMVNL